METDYEVTIDIALEYEVGSPPDGALDPYEVANEQEAKWTANWLCREEPLEGILGSSTSKLYPPFTATTRRQVFCVIDFVEDGTSTVTWGGVALAIGRLWITTDPGWDAAGVAVASLGEGHWFAAEGELEDDFRVFREGTAEAITL